MRQKDYYPTGSRDQYNAEGYRDMTAYLALRNIEREERAKRHAKRRQRTLPPRPEREELVVRIADLEAERGALCREMEGVSAQLSSFLSDLADPYRMSVLIERYVNLKTVEQIMEILGRSRSFVKVKHRSGFAEAKKLYEDRKKES